MDQAPTEAEIQIPNYDLELNTIWEEVEQVIQLISVSQSDSATMIAMLQSLV